MTRRFDLPVREDRPVVALHHALDEVVARLFIEILLLRHFIIHSIEVEEFGRLGRFCRVANGNLRTPETTPKSERTWW